MRKIAAVVVTYNRLELLKENISALGNIKNIDILVIDNASTDNTKEYVTGLKQKNIIYINTGKNLGGAGGFNRGVREAIERGYNYAWLMDDDTIVLDDSLNELLEASKYLKNDFSFLCSHVRWTDGTPCKMNIPRFNKKIYGNIDYIGEGLIEIRSCTFVSVLINLEIAKKAGLPITEFFIYGDDHEYTERLGKEKPGYYSVRSQVLHKMGSNTGFDIVDIPKERIDRYYYDSRNRIYRARKSGFKEFLIMLAWYVLIKFKIIIKAKDSRLKRLLVIIKGFYAGLFFHPKIEFAKKKESKK